MQEIRIDEFRQNTKRLTEYGRETARQNKDLRVFTKNFMDTRDLRTYI
jgi:hypothetical protein